MEIKDIWVTPEMAQQWLLRNTKNRRISDMVVDELAQKMKDGRFVLTHQGIAFDKSGELVDGQHRLHAIVKAGIPVHMMVATGLDGDSTILAIDCGKTRLPADSLRIKHGGDQIFSRFTTALAQMAWTVHNKLYNRASAEEVESMILKNRHLFETALEFGGNDKHRTPNVHLSLAAISAYMWSVPYSEIMDFMLLMRKKEIPATKSNKTVTMILNAAEHTRIASGGKKRIATYRLEKRMIFSYVRDCTRLVADRDYYPICIDDDFTIRRKQ